MLVANINASSSNGRTADSDSVNLGSSPGEAAITEALIFQGFFIFKAATVRKFRTTAADGKNYSTQFYNLDMIISLGYRIKSSIATQVRIWATERIIIKFYGIG